GAKVYDSVEGKTHEIYAKKVISASGIWLDELREKDGSKEGKQLHLTKGVHIVFSKEVFHLEQTIYFDTTDGRVIFDILRGVNRDIAKTDTYFDGELENTKTTVEDLDYILKAIDYMFPSLHISADDIESSWAGVRALFSEGNEDKPGEISRKDEIFISNSGLISIAGGKLTGYRKMAEDAVNTVVKQLKEEESLLYSSSQTKHLPISG